MGEIPSGITRYLENLDLSFNHLQGSIPSDLLSQRKLISVDLSFNQLVEWIPKSISPGLVRLRLGSNKLRGLLPSTTFKSLQNLAYLQLNNNSLTGHIPRELTSCQNLTLLNLGMNELSCILLPAFRNLTTLQVLNLQQNKLTGEIPDNIKFLSDLSILDVSWNSLSGFIPHSLLQLDKLSTINLQGNNLNGTIPDEIGNMKNLVELQLGQNQLHGKIPLMLPKLQISLNLSYNLFEGPIPPSFYHLDRLEVLDLSNNKFSGDISDLSSLVSLTQLILSNNQLTGRLPKFTHIDFINFTGNPGIELTNEDEVSTREKPSGKSKLPKVVIFVAFGAVTGIITFIFLNHSRHFKCTKNMQVDPDKERSNVLPEVIHGNLLTSDALRFAKAVAHPENAMYEMPSGLSYFIKKLNTRDRLVQQASNEQLEM